MALQFANIHVIGARLVFYLFQGFIVALCYYIVPNTSIIHYSFDQLLTVGLIATLVVICIDNMIPEIGVYIRYGIGMLVSSLTYF